MFVLLQVAVLADCFVPVSVLGPGVVFSVEFDSEVLE